MWKKIGEIVLVLVAIITLIVTVLQLIQNNQTSNTQDFTQSTQINILEQQLDVQQEIATLQAQASGSSSTATAISQRMEELHSTATALVTEELPTNSPFEISAYCAQFNKSPTYVDVGQEVVIKWGWYAKTSAYRQDYIDSVAFSLQLDGSEIDKSRATLELTTMDSGYYLATWRMPPMILAEGTHQVVITQIRRREVTDGFDNDNNGNLDIYKPGSESAPHCEITVR